jgi:hypothetical protein
VLDIEPVAGSAGDPEASDTSGVEDGKETAVSVEGGLAQAARPSSAVNSRTHERILCTDKLTDLVKTLLGENGMI